MSNEKKEQRKLPVLQGVLPIVSSHIPVDIVAGITLAALGIPEVMGYTKIAGMPVITGLYTLLLPITVFALLGSPATSSLEPTLPPPRSWPLASLVSRPGLVAVCSPGGRVGDYDRSHSGRRAFYQVGLSRQLLIQVRSHRLPHRRWYTSRYGAGGGNAGRENYWQWDDREIRQRHSANPTGQYCDSYYLPVCVGDHHRRWLDQRQDPGRVDRRGRSDHRQLRPQPLHRMVSRPWVRYKVVSRSLVCHRFS